MKQKIKKSEGWDMTMVQRRQDTNCRRREKEKKNERRERRFRREEMEEAVDMEGKR